MINTSVHEVTPKLRMESTGINCPISPALLRRFKRNNSSQQYNIITKDVYQTVIVPTVFPGQNWYAQNGHYQNEQDSSQSPFYQSQTCITSVNSNNNQCSSRIIATSYQSTPVTTGLVYQQPTTKTGPSAFMQHQLHQFRQQQYQIGQVVDCQKFLQNGSRPPGLPSPQRIVNLQGYDQLNRMASCSQTPVHSPSPKRSSRRHHHGHHHHRLGHTTAGPYDLLESEALQRRHKFPSNFCRILRECPPPVPPALLRPMLGALGTNGNKGQMAGSAVPRFKDEANRLKVTLRVFSSNSTVSGGGAVSSPEASFLVVDSRKKQATLMEQVQQQQRQRQALSSISQVQQQNTASANMVPKLFNFDAVFSPDDSQTEICSTTLTEIVQTVVNDGDACVLMFGSADQGKLHASIGNDTGSQSLGILPCAISWLYRLIGEVRQRNGARFSIRVSAVEVAGPQEELRDLLGELAVGSNGGSGGSTGFEVCLREDPVFGTQLHNVNELRAPTPDKAAFYLDAALAKRKAETEEERRNSHFFYTLHIYQYCVNDKQGEEPNSESSVVAGGRTRLHLIDLGAGEKSSKPGRASLTLPALGNVLLTLLQGQKHLPFKESKVTQILKSYIGSALCKAVSVVACASSDPERKMESVNVVQIAGRLYRIRRTKRGSARFGPGGTNSSGGETSTDERTGGRRRFPRSASDPDCTTSSSEQSCDTVIYLGAGGARSRNSSVVAISDQDITPANSREQSHGGIRYHPAKDHTGKDFGHQKSIKDPSVLQKSVRDPNAQQKSIKDFKTQSANRSGPNVSADAKQTAVVQASSTQPKSNELWIDGPKASKQPKLNSGQTSASHLKSAPLMDPFKREMIRQWVVNQEQERAAVGGTEVWIDGHPKTVAPNLLPVGSFEGTGARPKQFYSTPKPTSPPKEGDEISMDTSSTCSEMLGMDGTRDVSLQCCEEEIDFDCGRYNTIPSELYNENEESNLDNWYTCTSNNNTVNQEYAGWVEPEMRLLEDIAEVEEEETTTSTISDRHSATLRRAITQRASVEKDIPILPYPNASSSSLHSLSHGIPELHEDEDEEHPLRILSKEKFQSGSRSDTFSLENEDRTDASEIFLLLGGPRMLSTEDFTIQKFSNDEDSSSLTDEDLERAMQASLTSIRSHEILEKLKSEGKLRRSKESEEKSEDEEEDTLIVTTKIVTKKSSFGNPIRPEPEGVGCDEENGKSQKSMKTEDQYIPVQHYVEDKLVKPTVPQISKPMANLVTSQLLSGLSVQEKKSNEMGPLNIQPPETDSQRSSLPRPTKLASPKSSSTPTKPAKPSASLKPPKKIEKPKSTSNSNSKSSQISTSKSVPKPASPTHSTSVPDPNVKSKTKPTSPSSILKSPIVSFLKSPSKFKKTPAKSVDPTPTSASGTVVSRSELSVSPLATSTKPNPSPNSNSSTPAKRASSGYDSGHDSGIVTVDSPDLLLASPYSKLTRPRVSQRSSSGHGSDNSSAVSSDAGGNGAFSGGKLGKPCMAKCTMAAVSNTKVYSAGSIGVKTIRKKTSVSQDSSSGVYASSSGYESGAGKGRTVFVEDTVTSPETNENMENVQWAMTPQQERVRSPPSIKLQRKKWFDGVGFNISKSHSAPQSPNGAVKSPPSSRLHRLIRPGFELQQNRKEVEITPEHLLTVEKLKMRQKELKRELKMAKERLGVPPSKWSYDLHVSECMDISNPNMLEALQQETRILEKRVAACKSHILMVTVFDAVPSASESPDVARKCS